MATLVVYHKNSMEFKVVINQTMCSPNKIMYIYPVQKKINQNNWEKNSEMLLFFQVQVG